MILLAVVVFVPVATKSPTGAASQTFCAGKTVADLVATGTNIKWYNAAGNYLASGDTFITPTISASTIYYAENTSLHTDTAYAYPHNNALGSADYKNSAQYELFYADVDFTLISTKVYAQNAGSITVQLLSNLGAVLQTVTAAVPAGLSRVTLNFTFAELFRIR